MTEDDSRTWARVAVHEAGHVVAAHEFGIGLERVTVSPHAGRVYPAFPFRVKLDELAAFYLAGIAGEALITTDARPRTNTDTDEASARAVALTGEDAEACIARARTLARAVVLERGHDVARIANALLKRGELTGAELTALMQSDPTTEQEPPT